VAVTRGPVAIEPYARLIARGHIRMGECLIYRGAKNKKGYGRLGNEMAHRVAYAKWHGPIPKGMVLDHECHNEAARSGACNGGPSCIHRACINPGHLRVRTQAENINASPLTAKGRDIGGARINRAKTECPNGHSYSGSNLIIIPGGRRCRICRNSRNIASYHKRKLERRAREQ
jgi:HNH endonuclease